MAERLARELAGGVGRDGGENRVALAERHLGVHAINRRRRRDGDFFHARLARGFEHVDRALDVHALVKRRLGEAGPHARARGEVDDLIKPDRGKNFVERAAVRNVAVDKFK